MACRRLYVSQLDLNVTDEDLRCVFQDSFGPVDEGCNFTVLHGYFPLPLMVTFTFLTILLF